LRNSFRLIRGRENETKSELTLWLPRARLPAQLADATVIHRQLVRAGAAGTAAAAAALEALLPQLDATTAAEMNEIVTGVVGLAARVIVLSARTKSSASAGPAPLESFVTVSRYIEANLGARDLGVDKLARTFGLSRASLYRLFEPVGGVASYIRTRRLARARQELTTPAWKTAGSARSPIRLGSTTARSAPPMDRPREASVVRQAAAKLSRSKNHRVGWAS
jgi:AraC-like DNA-binding protein